MTSTDYSKVVIYVIKCLDEKITEEYIGSTTDFIKRKYQHKSNCNNEKSKEYNQLKYKIIRENGGYDNWTMIELEKYPCNDKREAEKKEEDIRVERNASLNMIKAFGGETKEEYLKKYREQNKDKMKEYYKEYREVNKYQIKEYREANKEKAKEKHKEWREENKDQIKEYKKEYREVNKEQIKEQKKEYNNKEYICSCGWIGTNNTKYYHLKKCNPIV